MKALRTKFICLIIFSNAFIFCYSQEKIENDKNYSFNVVLDMNDMSRRNDYNYKFLINKGWDFDENGLTKFLENKHLYYITFENKKVSEKGFDHYDRIPQDTLKMKLTDSQIDSIYVLTTELMTIDKNLNVIDKKSPEGNYDGEYASVKLELREYSTSNEIIISFDNEGVFQKRFNKLLEYLNSIKEN